MSVKNNMSVLTAMQNVIRNKFKTIQANRLEHDVEQTLKPLSVITSSTSSSQSTDNLEQKNFNSLHNVTNTRTYLHQLSSLNRSYSDNAINHFGLLVKVVRI